VQSVRGPAGLLFRWADTEERIARGEIQAGDVDAGDRMPQEVMLCGPAGTGKTWSALLFILHAARKYQGARIAICRQTRASLIQSACVTLRKILPENHIFLDGPSDEHRTGYHYGASEVYLGSLEEPGRLFSTEWDIVYVQEAVEISLDAWEKFGRGLRGRACPFTLLMGDTNPGPVGHWVQKRMQSGRTTELFVRHRDNVALWDAENERWHPYGETFLKRLKATCASDHNYRRLVLGEWTTASGAVWPEYDPKVHVTSLERDLHGNVEERELRRLDVREFYAGLDFGYGAPGCLTVAGFTGNRSLYQVAEVYQRGKLQDWWGNVLAEIHAQYPITTVFADAENKEMIDYLNDRLGVARQGSTAIVVPIKKGPGSVQKGLDIVRRRMSRTDGGPKLFFDSGALIGEPEEAMVLAGLPVSVRDEIPLYTFARLRALKNDDLTDGEKAQDKPDKDAHDHGCDATRYLCVGVENLEPIARRKVEAPPRAYGQIFDHEDVLRGDEYDEALREAQHAYRSV